MPSKVYTVLLVDDDENDFLLTQIYLEMAEQAEFQLTWASSYQAGLEHIRADSYDVYLLDFRLGSDTGLHLMQEALAQGCRKPMILLTGIEDHRIEQESMEMGASDYLVKDDTFSAPLLERTILHAIERKRLEEVIQRRSQIDRLLSQFSRLFLDEDINIAIYFALRRLGEVTSSDRCCIFQLTEQHTFRMRHEWCNDTMTSSVEGTTDSFPWFHQHLLKGTPIQIQNISDLPAEASLEKLALERQSIRSLLNVPMLYSGKSVGYICLHTIQSEKSWNTEDINALTVMGEMIAMAQERHYAERALATKTQELAQTLDNLQKTQEKFIQSAKMAALGNLVAGIAHEINTPVGNAITMASTLENSTQAIAANITHKTLTKSAFQNYLDTIRDASRIISKNLFRAGELVRSFKQVAVDQTSLKDRTFTIIPYLHEVMINLTPQLKKTSHSVTIEGDRTLNIHSDPGSFSQIITNLVLNSLSHAFPDGKAGHIQILVQSQNNQCIVEYQDNGVGISPENLDNIFEPFFTTARHKGGSGLGLNLVYNLVTQALQGTIVVSSEVGGGTKFTMTLPHKNNITE